MLLFSRKLGVAGAFAAWLAVLPARAAEPQPPGLNWVRLPGAESCISATALAQRVEGRVGRMLFASVSEAGLFVDGHVRPTPEPGWAVTLELSEPSGMVLGSRHMQFAGSQCRVIDEAVALVIAVTLYPNTSLLESGIPLDPSTAESLHALFGQEPTDPDPASLPSAPASHPGPNPEPRADAAAVAATTVPPTASDAWSYGAGAAGAGALGHLPGLSPGVSAHAWTSPPSAWPIEAGVAVFPGTTRRHGTGRVRFALLMASLVVCPWQPSWLRELSLCAGGEVGRLHVASHGFAGGSVTVNDAVASVLAAARLQARLAGPLHLRSALVLALPLDQRRYTVQAADGDIETMFRIPQLAARAELGLALAL